MEFTPDLLDDFVNRRVALFLGAGVSAGVRTRSGEPVKTWSEFLRESAAKTSKHDLITEVEELLAKDDFLFACELLKEHFEDDWEQILKQEYEKIGEITPLQEWLLKLNQRILVTTNFDLFLERQWEKIYTGATHHIQVKNGITSECFSAFRDEQNYLIKLHGSINSPDTMIFSLGDYATKAHANWQYNTFMEMLLVTHTILFVGFSMNDATITNLLEIYAKKYPKNRPHYAFLPDYTSERKIKIMKHHRKLYVIPYKSDDNHLELSSLVQTLCSKIHERKRILSINSILF